MNLYFRTLPETADLGFEMQKNQVLITDRNGAICEKPVKIRELEDL